MSVIPFFRLPGRRRRVSGTGVILFKDITVNERTPLHPVAVGPRQVIRRDRLKSVSRELFAGVGADEPGTAGH
jgi:hypothetical protein